MRVTISHLENGGGGGGHRAREPTADGISAPPGGTFLLAGRLATGPCAGPRQARRDSTNVGESWQSDARKDGSEVVVVVVVVCVWVWVCVVWVGV